MCIVLAAVISCSSPTGPQTDAGSSTDVPGYTDDTFFKTSGTQILNRQGDPVVIRGYGLGGWLLPEGYMFKIGEFGASRIYEKVEELLGPSETERWIKEFRDNYVTEKDIELMKEWGVDHVRIPFHYNLFYDIEKDEFVQEGFERIDKLLVWCKRNRVDVILDMHAAPGAQSDGPIADSDGEARFWTESEKYWPITIKIWEELARRYKDETIIIGYDIINEPVTPAPYGNVDLARFYSQIIKAIRDIDNNHILFIEGNYWATTFDYLYPPMDDNMVYAFHKYWNETDFGTIRYLITMRDQYNTPLWLGESGENSNTWFYETISLVESFDIGWNWWTHKKLETITSPLSAPDNDNYGKVIRYWKNEGPRPSAAEAKDGLFSMVESLKLENNISRPDVVAALFSPSFNVQNQPYTQNNIPGMIQAVHYDIGNVGVSYHDTNYKRVDNDPVQTTGNIGWEFRNDGVDIQKSEDAGSEYNVGWTESGEWLEYTVNITSGEYDIIISYASGISDSQIRFKLNDQTIISTTSLPNSGGYQNWRQLRLGTFDFPEGTHVLRLEVITGGFNISKIIIE